MGCGSSQQRIADPQTKGDDRAGGHAGTFKFLPDGTLLKAGKKEEIEFFEEFNNPSGKYYSELQILKPYIPEFYGIVEQDGKKWIKMKNVNHGLNNVSFMDIKMSDKSYTPDAPPEKIARQIEKDKKTTSIDHGFRLVGMVVKDDKGNTTLNLAKQCKELTIDKVPENIKQFLQCNGKNAVNIEAVKYYLAKMKEIREMFKTKLTRGMAASSLFFVLSNTDNKYELKMIDFAHVFPLSDGKRDEGYVKGLDSLIPMFERILTEAEANPPKPLGKSKGEGQGNENLAGGHAESFRFLPDGTLLKAGKKGEIEFFEEFNNPSGKYYNEMQILKPFIPEFFGIVEQDGKKWIKMKNVNHGLNNVSFMDIKMGDKSYSPDDPPEKVENQIQRAKMTTSFEYGFRLTGMSVKDDKGATSYKLHKQYGEITIDKVPEMIKTFLMCNSKNEINKEAVEFYLRKMKEILDIMETKTTRSMIASSLFFVLSNTDNKYELKLIDFAHVFPMKEGEKDTGYIKGLKNLIGIFEKL